MTVVISWLHMVPNIVSSYFAKAMTLQTSRKIFGKISRDEEALASKWQILDKSFLMEKSDKSKNDYNAGSQERLIMLCEIHCYLLIHFIEAILKRWIC